MSDTQPEARGMNQFELKIAVRELCDQSKLEAYQVAAVLDMLLDHYVLVAIDGRPR